MFMEFTPLSMFPITETYGLIEGAIAFCRCSYNNKVVNNFQALDNVLRTAAQILNKCNLMYDVVTSTVGIYG